MRSRNMFSKFFLLAATASFITGNASADEKSLTIYTYESFIADWGPGPKVKEAFEANCDCTIKWVGVEDGVALLNRLKLEGDKATASIVLGLDTNLVSEARATGLFAPHGIDTAAITVPGDVADDTFVPFDYGYFAVVYDTEAITTPPTSLKELVEGDANQKIVIQDPRTSTPGLGLLLWMKKVYGDDAGAAWKQFSDRILTVTPGWSEAYGLFTNGEAPMVLSYTTSPAYHMVAEDTDRYQAASFSEGHYMQVEVAGMLKSAPDKELAQAFLKFMISPEFQDIIPTTNWMLPVAATQNPLPDAFSKLVTPQQGLAFTPDEVAENRKAWVDEWLAALSK